MKNFYTPETFNQDKYQKTSWKIFLQHDNDRLRLIVQVATGRKYWPMFSLHPNFELGINDPILKEIKFSLNYYTHPMINRFIGELNIALSDLYRTDINLHEIKSGITKENFHSSHNF